MLENGCLGSFGEDMMNVDIVPPGEDSGLRYITGQKVPRPKDFARWLPRILRELFANFLIVT